MLRFFSLSAILFAAFLTTGAASLAAAELSPEEVRELEELLLRLGFDPGKVDDKVDEDTRTAIRRYQDFAVLPADGEATKSLLIEVRAIAAVVSDLRADAPPAPAPPQAPEAAAEAAPEAAPQSAPESREASASEPAGDAPASAPEPPEADTAAATSLTVTAAPEPQPVSPEPAATTPEPAAETLAQPAPEPFPEPDTTAALEPAPAVPESTPAAPAAEVGFDLESMITRLLAESASDHIARLGKPSLGEIQAGLAELGYDPGPPDGSMGPRTRNAIIAFQRDLGLPPDGQVSQRLQDAVRTARQARDGRPMASQPVRPSPPQVTASPATGNETAKGPVYGGDVVAEEAYRAFARGFQASARGEFDRAIILYGVVIKTPGLPPNHKAIAHFNRGNAQHYRGAYSEALADFNAALGIKPDFGPAYQNRGFTLDAMGARDDALEDFRKARELGLKRLGLRAPDSPPPPRAPRPADG